MGSVEWERGRGGRKGGGDKSEDRRDAMQGGWEGCGRAGDNVSGVRNVYVVDLID